MRMVSFFAGIGGAELALRPWVLPVAVVEIEKHARRVLERRFPHAQLFGDVSTLCTDALPDADIWTGGFPCHGISAAGKRRGLDDARSGLWRVWASLIKARRPRWVFVENSPRLRTRGLSVVLEDLHAAGYDARWCLLSAWDVGAWHWRERMWILAGPRGTWRAPGMFGERGAHDLPGDGVMVDGEVFNMPSATSGKPPSAIPTLVATDADKCSVAHGKGDLTLTGFARSGALPTPTTGAGGGSSRSGARGDEVPTLDGLARIGALPTPAVAMRPNQGRGRQGMGGPGCNGREGGDNLRTVFGRRTPLPSMAARDDRSGKGRQENSHAPQLPEVMGGVLNPEWVEVFMGYPRGWTDPEVTIPIGCFDEGFIAWGVPPSLPPRTGKDRRARIRCLGNAWVPAQARRAFSILRGVE